MQRMICISVEQHNRMLESYDKAMEELQELRELLQMTPGDVDEVAPVQQNGKTNSESKKPEKKMKVVKEELPGNAGKAL